MLKVAEEIEEKLKNANLVGSRVGGGFSFVNNSRDVQFNYTQRVVDGIKEITNNYHTNIEKVVNEVVSQYNDLKVCFTYRFDNFSFYISPKTDSSELKECEDEPYPYDDKKKEDYHNPKDLQMWDNTSELLLKTVNYYLDHVSLELEDMGTLNVLQEKLMKLNADKLLLSIGTLGAGRLMSRSQAKETLNMKEFKDNMKDVFTTCVNSSTIDESPMAYKPMDEIIENIQENAEIINIIKPIYNFKASE